MTDFLEWSFGVKPDLDACAEARRRWGWGCIVTGNDTGPFACVWRCGRPEPRVHLSADEEEARCYRARNCGAATCNPFLLHTVVDLRRPQKKRRRRRRAASVLVLP